ncbi:hypothetical protein BGX26_002802, partial [Mortierella sp. AD094]
MNGSQGQHVNTRLHDPSSQETIRISEAPQKLAAVDAIHEVDADNAHMPSDLYKESEGCVPISGETILAGYKSDSATADSCGIDQ